MLCSALIDPKRVSFFAVCALVLLCFTLGGTALADDKAEEKEEAAEEDDGLMDASADQAKAMADALKKAARKKKLGDIRPALEAIDGFKHESFIKPLLKLMNHKVGEAAETATNLLAERADEKCLKKMWKNAFSNKANHGRYGVRSRVVLAFGEKGIVLDKNKYKEVERDWRWMFGNPQERFAEPAANYIKYFELTQDKRHCRKLAEQLDEPMATNPNSPSNPPAEWWERRWKMWQPLKVAVVEALLEITGQEFDTTEQAKEWFEKNKKTFKFDW